MDRKARVLELRRDAYLTRLAGYHIMADTLERMADDMEREMVSHVSAEEVVPVVVVVVPKNVPCPVCGEHTPALTFDARDYTYGYECDCEHSWIEITTGGF